MTAHAPSCRRKSRICSLLTGIMLSIMLSSCGEMFDMPEYTGPTDFGIEGDVFFVTVGDSISLDTYFSPDTISIPSIYWTSLNPECVSAGNNVFKALSVGNTVIVGKTVDNELTDSCSIIVTEREDPDINITGPYDMVVFAELIINDSVANEDYVVTAEMDNETCGIGKALEHEGNRYLAIRIFTEDQDPNFISIRVRGRRNALDYTFGNMFVFDPDARGSLSNLVQLEVPYDVSYAYK